MRLPDPCAPLRSSLRPYRYSGRGQHTADDHVARGAGGRPEAGLAHESRQLEVTPAVGESEPSNEVGPGLLGDSRDAGRDQDLRVALFDRERQVAAPRESRSDAEKALSDERG